MRYKYSMPTIGLYSNRQTLGRSEPILRISVTTFIYLLELLLHDINVICVESDVLEYDNLCRN